MNLGFEVAGKGINARSQKGEFRLAYPSKVWNSLSEGEKAFFLDNAAYLSTICIPVVSGKRKLKYNTSKPFFKREFDSSVVKDIPSAVEGGSCSTNEEIRKFKNSRYVFSDSKAKKPVFDAKTGERAVIPFSCGKDSLLTLAVCSEIGLNPVPVYINDTVSPSENKYKTAALRKIAAEKKLDFGIVKNTFEKLNDFEFWNKEETDKGYSHLITSFCLFSMPFLKFHNAGYLIMGNELDLNSTFVNKDGVKCFPSYDQSFEGTKKLGRMMKKATKGKVRTGSVISPLHDIAIMKILHSRYPLLGKYQLSCCCLDASKNKRWCYGCPDCARFYVYMKALNLSPKLIGMNKNMLDKRHFRCHYLFNPDKKGRYEKADDDEQMKFAYYLAYRNGAKGYAIDRFREMFLDEIKENEDKLHKKYFGIHSSETIPKKLRKKIIPIYKEELF